MDNMGFRALIIDDDPEFVEDFKLLLPNEIVCHAASSPCDAFQYLQDNNIELVFLDIDLGGNISGIDILKQIKSQWPGLPIIMVTADHSIETIVNAMRMGALDYVGKSPDMKKLKLSIEKALTCSRLYKKIELLESELEDRIGDMVGESKAIKRIREEMLRLSGVNSNVLITGQSGTGKELVARGIHRLSKNYGQPFIAVNCAALSKDLFESELFGHEKGAFTGAVSRRTGKFELVESGTLFLDEITEIPINLQAKLLRVIQEREFERVGGNSLNRFHGRIMASSNRDLSKSITERILREDLYYRLNVTVIELPPLSGRKEDLPLLMNHFIKMKSSEMKKKISGLSDDAVRLLIAYDWPGNVRELANCIENAIVHCDGLILKPEHFSQIRPNGTQLFKSYDEAKRHILASFQRDYITALLKNNAGNISRTAREMDLSRQGLIKIMKSCGIDSSE